MNTTKHLSRGLVEALGLAAALAVILPSSAVAVGCDGSSVVCGRPSAATSLPAGWDPDAVPLAALHGQTLAQYIANHEYHETALSHVEP